MRELPKVLCGGFARSGTSFLCNLIEVLGFSPGRPRRLKVPDEHNPRGYWEFRPVRKVTWDTAGVNQTLWQNRAHTLPDRPPRLDRHRNAIRVRKLVQQYKIEVYKDNYLPVVYTMFPASAKIVFIERDWQDIYASTMRIKPRRGPRKETPEEFRQAVEKFNGLAKMMAKERTCLFVRYEWFRDDFDTATKAVADFLGVRQYDAGEARAIWAPNPKR